MTTHNGNSQIGRFAAWAFVSAAMGIASCSSSSGTTAVTTDLTWNEDIGPLVQANCGSCHYAGGSGHFDLMNYSSAKSWGPTALSAIKSGRMPPWPPSSNCREYLGDRTMAEDAIAKFEEWVAGGMPQGAGEAKSFMPVPVAKLRPDLTAKMPEPYTPDESLTDDYRCFILDLDFPADTWVEGVDVVPATLQVHHVLTYAMNGSTLEAALKADNDEPGPGYTCFGGPNPKNTSGMTAAATGGLPLQVGAWVPGSQSQPLPANTALLIPGGSRLVMQVHYNTVTGKPVPDQTSITMQTRPDAPEFLYRTVPVAQPKLDIPAGDPAAAHSITIKHWGQSPTTLIGVAGHMHTLGTNIRGTILHTDNQQECLLDIPDWDFQWQMQYRLPADDYAIVKPGDSFKLDCIYDNSAANQPMVDGVPREPQDVAWGEGTYDEMCLMYLGTISPWVAPDPNATTACAAASECMKACNPQSASCMLNCENLNTACMTCTVKGLAGCGAISCAANLQAVQACLIPCALSVNAFGGSVGACLSESCPDEWKSVTECLDPYLTDPKCDGALTGCGL